MARKKGSKNRRRSITGRRRQTPTAMEQPAAAAMEQPAPAAMEQPAAAVMEQPAVAAAAIEPQPPPVPELPQPPAIIRTGTVAAPFAVPPDIVAPTVASATQRSYEVYCNSTLSPHVPAPKKIRIHRTPNRIERLTKRNQELMKRNSYLEKRHTDNEKIKNDAVEQAILKEFNHWQQQVDNASQRELHLRDRLREKQDQCVDMAAKHKLAIKKLEDQHETEINIITKNLSDEIDVQTTSVREKLQGRIRELQRKYSDLFKEKKHTDRLNVNLKTQLHHRNKENTKLHQKVQDLQGTISDLRTSIKRHTEAITRNRQSLKLTKEQTRQLQQEKNSLSSIVEGRSYEREQLASTNKKLANENEKLASATKELFFESTRNKEMYQKLLNINSELADNLLLLEEELDKAKATAPVDVFQRDFRTTKTAKPTYCIPVWTAVLEALTNYTPPTAIRKNLVTFAKLFSPTTDFKQLPQVDWIRKCRTVLAVITQVLAAKALAEADSWNSIFTDATTRRHSSKHCLVVDVSTVLKPRPPVLLTANIIPRNDTTETVRNAILHAIQSNGLRLDDWSKICENMYPGKSHSIPSSKQVDIAKLAKNGTVHTDTCNSARALKRCLIAEITKAAIDSGKFEKEEVNVIGVDCHNHCRNLWVKWMKFDVGKKVKDELKEGLSELPFNSRVSTDFNDILLSFDKTFKDTTEYSNGHGIDATLILGW